MKVSRPHMPGYGILDAESGTGLLPWSWADERLSSARNYFVSTTRPDGRPHVMPVWGIWLNRGFYFSTGPGSTKVRNLRANPHCVVSPEGGGRAVIVEGLAQIESDPDVLRPFVVAYKEKYDWQIDLSDPKQSGIWRVTPRVVFAFNETDDFVGSATRWVFEDGD